MPQEHEQEVLIRTLARDSRALAQNEPLQPEHVAVHPERVVDQPSSAGAEQQPKKSGRTAFLLLFVFLVLGSMLAYLLLTQE